MIELRSLGGIHNMNLHIAICDDQRQDASRLEELLMKQITSLQGMTASIEIFESGQTLLQAMTNTAYDIVYLDMEMPEYNGIEVAEKIRLKDLKGINYLCHQPYKLYEKKLCGSSLSLSAETH